MITTTVVVKTMVEEEFDFDEGDVENGMIRMMKPAAEATASDAGSDS